MGRKYKLTSIIKDSPVRRLRYLKNSIAPAPLRYGDHIRAYYLKAAEVVTKRKGPMVISSHYVPKEPKKEEIADMIEILNGKNVVATYGCIGDGIVDLVSPWY